MKSIHENCVRYGKNGSYVNYVQGANMAGFVKVADAMVHRHRIVLFDCDVAPVSRGELAEPRLTLSVSMAAEPETCFMCRYYARYSTEHGTPGVGSVFRGLIPGDNIVWQVDSLDDYVPFVVANCQHAPAREKGRLFPLCRTSAPDAGRPA